MQAMVTPSTKQAISKAALALNTSVSALCADLIEATYGKAGKVELNTQQLAAIGGFNTGATTGKDQEGNWYHDLTLKAHGIVFFVVDETVVAICGAGSDTVSQYMGWHVNWLKRPTSKDGKLQAKLSKHHAEYGGTVELWFKASAEPVEEARLLRKRYSVAWQGSTSKGAK